MNQDNLIKTKINFNGRGIDRHIISHEFHGICNELICAICMGLVYKPVNCKNCDNMFCSACIEEWAETSKAKTCPFQCKYEPKKTHFTIVNILDKIVLKCFNYELGCGSSFFYKDLHAHLNICDYSLLECVCGETSLKKNFINHLIGCKSLYKIIASDASFYCTHCSSRIFNDLNHSLNCPEYKRECVLCKVVIKEKDHLNHLIKDCHGITCLDKDSMELLKKFIKREENPFEYYKLKQGSNLKESEKSRITMEMEQKLLSLVKENGALRTSNLDLRIALKDEKDKQEQMITNHLHITDSYVKEIEELQKKLTKTQNHFLKDKKDMDGLNNDIPQDDSNIDNLQNHHDSEMRNDIINFQFNTNKALLPMPEPEHTKEEDEDYDWNSKEYDKNEEDIVEDLDEALEDLLAKSSAALKSLKYEIKELMNPNECDKNEKEAP